MPADLVYSEDLIPGSLDGCLLPIFSCGGSERGLYFKGDDPIGEASTLMT